MAIIDAQASIGGEAVVSISLDDAHTGIALNRAVTLAELRRHKRAFIKLATQNNWTRLQNMQDARNLFINYLENNVQ